MPEAGDAEGDTFSSIEIINASFHDDTIIGDDGDNIIRGGRGADIIDGRDGFDTADYSTADEAIALDLSTGEGTAGEAAGDMLSNIERVIGSSYDDEIEGSDVDESFDGGFGDDAIGGAGGSDSYHFGFDSGNDTVTESGLAGDTDRIVMAPEIRPQDVSVIRDGDDLLLELEQDDGLLIDTLRVLDHFLDEQRGIEEIVFENGTVWDRAAIDTLQRVGRFNASDDIIRFADEDIPLIITADRLTGNDAAEGTDDLQIVSVEDVSGGTTLLRSDGSVLFTGAPDYNGDAFFDYTVRDPNGRESTARAEVNILPVNDAPIGFDDGVFEGIEDEVLIIPLADVLGNDVDVDGDVLSIAGFSAVTGPDGELINPGIFNLGTNGSASVFAGNVLFAPAADHFGYAAFEYTVTDPDGETSTAIVTLNIAAVNDAPDAARDQRIARLGRSELIEIDTLLSNDSDKEGDAFSFTGVAAGANGTVAMLNLAGTEVTDAAEAHYIRFDGLELGSASFTYEITDIFGASSNGRVDLEVIPLNDPPRARNDGGFETLEDQIIIIDPALLLENDDDPNGDAIDITGFERFPLNGRVEWTPDGMIAFHPRSDYNGNAGFTYILTDDKGDSDTAFVSILIMPDNDAPVLRDDVIDGVEDEPVTVIPAEAFANDGDADGDLLFFESANVLGVLNVDFTDRETYSETIKLSSAVVIQTTASAATDAAGEALPAWLSFDPLAATFTGLPPVDVTDTFEVTVELVDTNLVSGVETAYSRSFILDPADLAAGDVVYPVEQTNTVGAALAGGGALPSWLAFDPATLIFTGTPGNPGDPAFDVEITFTAVDPESGAASIYSDTISIDPSDTAALSSGIAYSPDYLVLSAGAGTYSAAQWTGRPLPGWLAFDAETLSFSQTSIPPSPDEDITRVWLSFTPEGEEDQTWAIELRIDPFAPFDEIQNQLFLNAPYFSALGLMVVPVAGDETYTAQKAYLTDLPDWLSFNPDTLTLEGDPPEKYVGTLPVRVDIGASAASGMPPFSIIYNVVIDTDYELIGGAGFSLNVFDELIDIGVPADFDGAFAIEYYARDTKGAISEEPAIIVVNMDPRPEVPVAEDDSGFIVPKNGAIDIMLADLLANDSDGDDDPIHIVSIGQPQIGTLSVTIPEFSSELSGVDVGTNAVHSAMLSDGSPLPSWLQIDAATGRLFGIPPLAEMQSYAVIITSTGDNGTVETTTNLDVNGNTDAYLTFTSVADYSGPVFFQYELTDDLHGSDTALVRLDVEYEDEPPVGVDDRVDGVEDQQLVIDPADLTANDTDVDDDPLEITSVLNAVNGLVEMISGSIVFTPDQDFFGDAFFDYIVTDNTHGSDTATVTVQVAENNAAPVTAIDRFAGIEDTPFVVSPQILMSNDSDPDGDTLTLVDITVGPEGSVSLLPDGSYSIVARDNFTGELSVTYRITDGRRNSAEENNIVIDFAPVNDDPVAEEDGTFSTPEDTIIALDIAGLLANDSDIEGDLISFDGVLDPVNGSVEAIGNQVVFTPRSDYFGNAGFSYRISDGNGGTGTGFVSISVVPSQDLPIAVSDSGWQIDEDTFIDIDPAELLANDVDPDGDPIFFAGASGSGVEVLDNGWIRFTPAPDANGQLGGNYRIVDLNGIEITGTFTVDVVPVNDAPTARNDNFNLPEDQTLTVSLAQLMNNDSDADGHSLTISSVSNAIGGTVSFDGLGNVVFVPEANRTTSARFDYLLTDITGETDTATVTINLTAVNDAPVIAPIDDLVGTEDVRFVGQLPADAFSDIDGDELILSVRSAGGTPIPDWLVFQPDTLGLVGDPPADFNGTVALEVVADDGTTETVRSFNLIIDNVNDAPVAGDDVVQGYEDQPTIVSIASLLVNDSDVDSDPMEISALSTGDGYTAVFDGNGNVVITRDADLFGDFEVGYTLSDGETTDDAVITVSLAPVNDRPVTKPIDDVSVNEDESIDIALPADFATDVDGDTLTVTAAREDGMPLPTWLDFDAGANRFTGQPPANFFGTIAIAVTASDGALASTSTFELVVQPVNDAPLLELPFSDRFVDEDENFNMQLQQGLFSDVEGDELSYSMSLADGSDLPAWLTADTDNLRLIGVPPADFNGEIDIRITASDGTASTSDVFTLTLIPVNDAPYADNLLPDRPLAGEEIVTGTPFAIEIPADTFADVDGDPLQFAAMLADGTALPDWLSFDGTQLFGTAPQGSADVYEIQILATDGQEVATDEFLIAIAEGDFNAAPIAVADSFNMRGNISRTVSQQKLLSNDSDPDGDALEITAVDSASDGTVELLANGRIKFTPDPGFEGEAEFFYTVSDGEETDRARVAVAVSDPYENVEEGGQESDLLIADTRTGDSHLSGGAGDDFLLSFAGNDTLRGGSGNDLIFSGSGDDRLRGGSGDDFMFGGRGNDRLSGGRGDDTLFGGRGDDRISGGKGDDLLFGGSGSDVFTYRFGDGSDRIMDYQAPRSGRRFNVEGDRIRLDVDGIDSFEDLLAVGQNQNGGVLFDFGDGNELFLSGTRLGALDGDTFSFF